MGGPLYSHRSVVVAAPMQRPASHSLLTAQAKTDYQVKTLIPVTLLKLSQAIPDPGGAQRADSSLLHLSVGAGG